MWCDADVIYALSVYLFWLKQIIRHVLGWEEILTFFCGLGSSKLHCFYPCAGYVDRLCCFLSDISYIHMKHQFETRCLHNKWSQYRYVCALLADSKDLWHFYDLWFFFFFFFLASCTQWIIIHFCCMNTWGWLSKIRTSRPEWLTTPAGPVKIYLARKPGIIFLHPKYIKIIQTAACFSKSWATVCGHL